MSHARTLWEEGREPGRQVVALGAAVALTAVVIDMAVVGRVSLFFDLCFVTLCVALALTVRPTDFFTVGVLPPLIMVGVFTLLGLTRPDAIADRGDGVVQAVVSGLSHHSVALVVGYLLCLGCLAMRERMAQQDQAANRSGSPAPRRTTSG
ncbi:DUF6542 domain-containing protein [Nocardioides sp. MAHUQ-72]|uniref:DUF6542 domain-containing protein n=1 Tax=unclassified Nocardioides TaxID=2615069 RepID=UPI00361298ED